MSTSHMPHLVVVNHAPQQREEHLGIHIVSRGVERKRTMVMTATMAYKVAAAGAALLLLLTVC